MPRKKKQAQIHLKHLLYLKALNMKLLLKS